MDDLKKYPRGYWTEENAVKELKKLVDNLGYFPSASKMPRELWLGIKKQKKSINYFANLLGFPPNQKPKGYWLSWTNLEFEILKLIESNCETFPNLAQIEEKLGGRGKWAVLNNGGIFEVARKMG